ncbi:hypothetical protein [Enterococcus larvae]|uniref:hypothetical protein n=1 Tax=Enterococcus larvae TaxID=2794352 RepID=UPI003F2D2245
MLAVVGLLLFVIGSGLFVFGIIKIFIKSKKRTRSSTLFISGAVFFLIGSFILYQVGSSDNEIAKKESEEAEKKSTSKSESRVSEIPSSSVALETSSSESVISTEQETQPNEELTLINSEIQEHLDLNKGWALGTIDENGNAIEGGTPNAEYANWIYVNSITYDGSQVDVQVTADFLSLSESEKNSLASSCQGIAMSNALLDSRPSIYFYNGENSYGHTKILDKNSYTWY